MENAPTRTFVQGGNLSLRSWLRRRKLPAAIVILLVSTITAGVIILRSKQPENTATILSAIVAVPVLVATVMALIAGIRPKPRRRRLTNSDLTALATRLHDFWRTEGAERGITTPSTVTVAWNLADVDLNQPEARVATGGTPAALPAEIKSEPLTAGVLQDLYSLYETATRGKLVIRGSGGSGKTASLILLLLTAASNREASPASISATAPIPVLLPISEWRPRKQSLRAWTLQTLKRDHPFLAAMDHDKSLEDFLFGSSRIALFLDGLDEMPVGETARALRYIETESSVRIVLTVRPEFLAGHLSSGGLQGVPIVDLLPVPPRSAEAYLTEAQNTAKKQAWKVVTTRWNGSNDPIREALSTPLMLNLSRTTYASIERDPSELMDRVRFPDADAIRQHLVASILPTAISEPDALRRARDTTGWIATEMTRQNTNDFPWWRVRAWRFRWVPSVVVSVLHGLLAFGAFLIVGQGSGVTLALSTSWALGCAACSGLLTNYWLPRLIVGLHGNGARILVALDLFTLFSVSLIQLGRAAGGAEFGMVEAIATGLGCGALAGIGVGLVSLHDGYMHASIRWPSPGEVAAGAAGGILCLVVLSPVISIPVAGACAIVASLGYMAVGAWTRPPSNFMSLTSPMSTFSSDVRASYWFAALGGTVVGFAAATVSYASGASHAVLLGIYVALCAGLAGGVSTSRAAACQLVWWVQAVRHLEPLTSLPKYLKQMHKVGVLRQSGAVYQFRHAELQSYLSSN